MVIPAIKIMGLMREILMLKIKKKASKTIPLGLKVVLIMFHKIKVHKERLMVVN